YPWPLTEHPITNSTGAVGPVKPSTTPPPPKQPKNNLSADRRFTLPERIGVCTLQIGKSSRGMSGSVATCAECHQLFKSGFSVFQFVSTAGSEVHLRCGTRTQTG